MVEHFVRCACGVVAMDRTSLPSPCQQHGEVSVADYVRADAYRRVVRTLDEADVQLTRIADETDEATGEDIDSVRALLKDAIAAAGVQP